MLLLGSVIHSTKFATAVCTTNATLARWEASSSAKNGNLSCIADTAWVENRPEYCFNLRSSVSGTLSSSSSVDRGIANCLSVTPKIYASYVDGSAKDALRRCAPHAARGGRSAVGLRGLQAPGPGSEVCTGA